MSLHTLAQHLQSAGRGEDKVLVHMTPHEVSGLQSLAMAHGGSLTINPETGLPEAGFLSGILPMIAGAALNMAVPGLGAAGSGLLVGAAGAAATGSLSKGLMMGLGAYGGAGLGAGLGLTEAAAGAGASSLGSAQTIAAQNAANTAAANASQIGNTMGAGTMASGVMAPPVTAPLAGVQGFVPGTPTTVNTPVVSTAPATAATSGAPSVESSIMDRLKTAGGNVVKLFGSSDEDKAYRDAFLKEQKLPLMGAGLAAISLSREEPKMPSNQTAYVNPTASRLYPEGKLQTTSGRYEAGPIGNASGERSYRFFADGGLANLPVEQMSQQASTGQNTNYPMANIRPYGYAVPRNNPVSENVFKPMDYQNVDPYTGEQKFAGGGLASLVAMKSGGFVSKLKAVAKPTEVKPKLQSTDVFDKKLASLDKYKNLDEVQGRYNDLQSQLKDLQANKKDRDAQAAAAKKDYEAAIAAINKEKTSSLKGLNTDFANRIKDIQNDKGMSAADKKTNIANIQKEQKEAQTNLNNDFANRIKDRQGEYKNYQTDLTNFNKEYGVKVADINKELSNAKNAATYAKQYQETVAARDKVIAANELATNKAKEQNDAAMAAYNKYQEDLSAEKQAWQEETGRKATGLQAISPVTKTTKLTDAEIAKLPYTLSPTGEKIYSTPTEKTEVTKFTKVPGFSGVKKIIEPEDVVAVFQDVAGRRPTQQELDTFVGKSNLSQADLAAYAMKLPDVAAKVDYNEDDVKENWKYYIGRDPTSGELKNVMNEVKAGRISNFNQMRNYIQARPQYLENINKVAEQVYQTKQQSVADAMKEQQRLASSLTMGQIKGAYQDVLNRTPTLEEAEKYLGAQQTQGGLADLLKGTEEYKKVATTPLVQQPTAAPQVIKPAVSYAPGEILSYKPEAQPGTGLDIPQGRNLLSFDKALYPATPTFMQQLGIQGLASQAAEKAPQLQTGLQFGAAQPQQSTFGFQPYAAPTGTQSPQAIEALLAALRAQQQQGVTQMAGGGYAGGGYHLGDYSDGGRLLKGPGDGVSDSIPASIGGRQPARLADGEFVIPARIVSELGNGSTDAGARKLYAMMDRIQRARSKTVGKERVAVDSKAEKMLPV